METDQLIRLIDAVSSSKLTDFEYEQEGLRLHLAKKETCNGNVIRNMEEPAGAEMAEPQGQKKMEEPEGRFVKSPLVGTFYAAPAEGEAPFVSVGDTVKKGQTLAIIEAMKLMNEIESECDGTVAEILVKNQEAVEYGQPLFRILES